MHLVNFGTLGKQLDFDSANEILNVICENYTTTDMIIWSYKRSRIAIVSDPSLELYFRGG